MKTYAPIFSGFYETEFSMKMSVDEIANELLENIDDFNDNEKYLLRQYIENNYDDCIKTDYKEYENEVAHKVCEFLSEQVSVCLHTDVEFEFENIYSPQYYNFKNDSINVNLKCDTDEFMKKLLSMVQSHKKEFQEYLEATYTSCDGFISFYSNNIEDWLKEEYNEHEIGSMLEFVLKLCNKDIYTEMVYYVIENVWEGGYYHFTEKFDKFLENDDLHKILNEFKKMCLQKDEYIAIMRSQEKEINPKAVDTEKIEKEMIEKMKEIFKEI